MKEKDYITTVRIVYTIGMVALLLLLSRYYPLVAISIGIAILFILVIVAILRWVFLVEKRMMLLADIKDYLKELNIVSREIKKSLGSIKERINPDNTNEIKAEEQPKITRKIQVNCPYCPAFFNIPKEYMNRKIKCTKCKKEFLVKQL